ncbi:MAG: hypothetical protein ACM31I_10250 [Deltaproteobacteria bacterium]
MNQAVKKGSPEVAPSAAASVAGVTPASAPPACPTCKDSKRVIFVEKKRGLKSVGPCECVKA